MTGVGAKTTYRTLRRACTAPVAWVASRSSRRQLILADTERAVVLHGFPAEEFEASIRTLTANCVEYRNILYYRLESGDTLDRLFAVLARRIWPPLASFEIACPSIGPGFVARHAHGTIITATHIGRNLTVHHQVTIGWGADPKHPPSVGDDVFIGTGAKVLGAISIGDRARIGANAVVVTDLPDDCTAVGVPARIRTSGRDHRDLRS